MLTGTCKLICLFIKKLNQKITMLPYAHQCLKQHAKKVVSDSPGLVDFAIGLVIFVLSLPNGQVMFFWEIQITEGL